MKNLKNISPQKLQCLKLFMNYDLLTAIVEFHIFLGHAFLESSSAALHIELMLVLEWLPSK